MTVMTKKLTVLSGLFAATVLLGGMATVSAASAQDCVTTRAPVAQSQQHVKHARSTAAQANSCAATGNQASLTSQSTASLASTETSHSSDNPNNRS
jgi:hypothetical protein